MKKLLTFALTVAFCAKAFPQAKQVPYSSTFYQDGDWTVVNTVEGTSTWEDNDYSRDFKGTGFTVGKEYHYDRKNPADDWLISPAIRLQGGKEYKVSFWLDAGQSENIRLCWSQSGAVEALSAEGSVLYDFDFVDWGWQRVSKVIVPPADGDYHFGFHAYSEADQNNIEITGFELKENSFVPAAPTNLAVVPDVNEGVMAVVSWALPTKDNDGADMPEGATFDKVEVFRDGILVQTLAGDAVSFTDTEALGLTVGKHIYGVSVTVNGIEGAKAEIQSRHIGPLPTCTLPWTAGIGQLTAEDFETYYAVIKGDKSQTSGSRGWALKSGCIQFYPSRWDRQDDWLIMPKVRFEKAGVYRLRTIAEFNETTDRPCIAVWKGTGKTIVHMTEKLGAFTSLPQTKSDVYVAFEITEPGEYNLALHAAVEEPETSKYLKFHEFFLEEANALPLGVNDLIISVEGGCVKLMWTAPEAYNTGKKLEFITKIEIYRNNKLVNAVIDNVVPGAAMEYIDTPETGGVFTYKVIPYVGEFVPDSEPLAVSTSWIGDKLQHLPYDLNFADGADVSIVRELWNIRNNDNDSYKWSVDDSGFTLSLDEDGGKADDMLVSPPFSLVQGEYDIILSVKGGESDFPLTVGFMVEGTDTISNPQSVILNGKNTYADYEATAKVDVPAVEIQDGMRSQEEIRGSLIIFADGIYDWDPYNVIIQRVAISPKNQDPGPGVGIEAVETAGNDEKRYFDLNGFEVARPQKGTIYIVRAPEGRVLKEVF